MFRILGLWAYHEPTRHNVADVMPVLTEAIHTDDPHIEHLQQQQQQQVDEYLCTHRDVQEKQGTKGYCQGYLIWRFVQ